MKRIRVTLSCLLLCFTFSAIASDFTCPTPDELKNFAVDNSLALQQRDEESWSIVRSKKTPTGLDLLWVINANNPDQAILSYEQLVAPYKDIYVNDFRYKACFYNTFTHDAAIVFVHYVNSDNYYTAPISRFVLFQIIKDSAKKMSDYLDNLVDTEM